MSDPNSRKTSKHWLCFIDLNNSKAQCKICNRILSFKGSSVHSLSRHTKAKHFDIYKKIHIDNDLTDLEFGEYKMHFIIYCNYK